MKKLLFSLLLTQNVQAQNFVIDTSNYSWKSYEKIDFQQVDMTLYKSTNERDKQDASKLVIMSASGGGLRAAAFTIGVLMELERISPVATSVNRTNSVNAANEIDYFSTVSGGGWGAGCFVAYRYCLAKGVLNTPRSFNEFETYLNNIVDRKYERYQLNYALGGLLSSRFNRSSSFTFANRLNYGYLCYGHIVDGAEEEWKLKHDGSKVAFDRNSPDLVELGDMFVLNSSNKKVELPILIANTTNTSNFSLVPFTPDRLAYWGVRQFESTIPGDPTPSKAGEALRIEDLLHVPLAWAIKSSSSVPVAIGATSYLCRKFNHDYSLFLEDGGVVDNQGLHTTKTILENEKTIKANSDRIVFAVDAAKGGISNSMPQSATLGRIRTGANIATAAAPDAQYNIMRENLNRLEKEYNCTVIYLGTECLLDPSLGQKPSTNLPSHQIISKQEAENLFDRMDMSARNDPKYFISTCTYEDRRILYEYIRTYIKTWFSAKETVSEGVYIDDKPSESKGYGKIMKLAGKAVVQLQSERIYGLFYH